MTIRGPWGSGVLGVCAVAGWLATGCVGADSGDASGGAGGESQPRRDAGPLLADQGPPPTGGTMDTGPGPAQTVDSGATGGTGGGDGGSTADVGLDGGSGGLAGDVGRAGVEADVGPGLPDAAGAGERCADHAVVDLTAWLARNPAYDGDTAAEPATLAASCGGAAGGEVVFSYDVERPLDRLVFRTDHPETRAPTVLYVRRVCDVVEDLACNRGSPEAPGTRVTLENVQPGRYFVIVDTGSREGGGPFRLSVDTTGAAACRDAEDNDGDGRVDLADPGCVTPDDQNEADPAVAPACADSQDNDGDGLTDYPADDDCAAAGGEREGPLCTAPYPLTEVGPEGGVFPVAFDFASAGLTLGSCGDGQGQEAVFVLHLDQPSRLRAGLRLGPNLGEMAFGTTYIRSACDDPRSEFGCVTENAQPIPFPHVPRLEPGDYFVFAEFGFNWAPQDVTIQPNMLFEVESLVRQCNDEADNDADGRIDLEDFGCARPVDDLESDDPPEPPACADGIDNDMDGAIDYPVDPNCAAAGSNFEAGCEGNALWQPVECAITSWVWSSDSRFGDLASAEENRVLYSGCTHDGQNPEGLCSLDGTGWVSVDSFPMQGCDATWWHIGGEFTGQCGGHDGDTVRHLVLSSDACWDYR